MQLLPRWRLWQSCKLPQGGLLLQHATSGSEDRAGFRCCFACAGERRTSVLYFPLFHPESVWLTVQGTETSGVLVSSFQGHVQERQIWNFAVYSALTSFNRGLHVAPQLFEGLSLTPLVLPWESYRQWDPHNLCFPASLSCCDSGGSNIIFVRLEDFFLMAWI